MISPVSAATLLNATSDPLPDLLDVAQMIDIQNVVHSDWGYKVPLVGNRNKQAFATQVAARFAERKGVQLALNRLAISANFLEQRDACEAHA